MMGRRFNTWLILVLVASFLTSCLSRPERLRTTLPSSPSSTPVRNNPSSGNIFNKYADIIGVDAKDLKNYELYRYIDEWMGIPHRLGGQDKKGIDCSAFANHLILDVYGKNLPRTAKDMAEVVKRKYENQLKEGDLVFFNFDGKAFDHVGIYLGNNKFVHVSTSKGVIISNLKDPWYWKYFSRAGSVL